MKTLRWILILSCSLFFRPSNLFAQWVQTSGPEGVSVPKRFALDQNYPNPFNPTTAISYQLSAVGFVSLKVYDLLGREVATLVDEVRPAGFYTVRWNASSMPSGVYLYRLQTRDFVQTKKMILLK